MDLEILKSIGLSKNESAVYLALLSSGESSVLDVSEKIHKNRTHVYDLLRALVDKGLVSYTISHNRRLFCATDPERLIDYLEEREKEIRKQKENIRKELPLLMRLQNSVKGKTKVEVYQGKEGIKTVYNEILRSTKEYAILGATGKIARALEFYFPHHERERVKRKIRLKILCNPTLRHEEITKERAYCDVKFFPKGVTSPVPTLLFKEKVVILDWEELSAIVLESKNIAQVYQTYFELLWKSAEK